MVQEQSLQSKQLHLQGLPRQRGWHRKANAYHSKPQINLQALANLMEVYCTKIHQYFVLLQLSINAQPYVSILASFDVQYNNLLLLLQPKNLPQLQQTLLIPPISKSLH